MGESRAGAIERSALLVASIGVPSPSIYPCVDVFPAFAAVESPAEATAGGRGSPQQRRERACRPIASICLACLHVDQHSFIVQQAESTDHSRTEREALECNSRAA